MSLSAGQILKGSALCALLMLSGQAAALSGSVSAEYVRGFEPGDPAVMGSLSLSERINRTMTLGLQQDVTKNLVIDSENEEWEASDTRISLGIKMSSGLQGLSYRLTPSLTLPVSKSSQRQEIYSKPQIRALAQYASEEGAFSVSAGTFFRDVISAYETAPAEEGEGGEVLADYAYGFDHSLSVSGYGFSVGYDVSYVETRYHKQDRAASEGQDFRNNLPTQGYSLSVSLSRDLWQGASLSLAYLTGSALKQEGYEDYVIYDSAVSQYSLGFSQSF